MDGLLNKVLMHLFVEEAVSKFAVPSAVTLYDRLQKKRQMAERDAGAEGNPETFPYRDNWKSADSYARILADDNGAKPSDQTIRSRVLEEDHFLDQECIVNSRCGGAYSSPLRDMYMGMVGERLKVRLAFVEVSPEFRQPHSDLREALYKKYDTCQGDLGIPGENQGTKNSAHFFVKHLSRILEGHTIGSIPSEQELKEKIVEEFRWIERSLGSGSEDRRFGVVSKANRPGLVRVRDFLVDLMPELLDRDKGFSAANKADRTMTPC